VSIAQTKPDTEAPGHPEHPDFFRAK
jgi:hypothetical protein